MTFSLTWTAVFLGLYRPISMSHSILLMSGSVPAKLVESPLVWSESFTPCERFRRCGQRSMDVILPLVSLGVNVLWNLLYLFMVSCPIQWMLFALFHHNWQKRLDLKVWPWNYLCVVCHLASYYGLVTNWNWRWRTGCIYWRKSNQWMPFAATRIAGAQHPVRSGQHYPWRGSKRHGRTAQHLEMQTNPAGNDWGRSDWSHEYGEVVYDAGCSLTKLLRFFQNSWLSITTMLPPVTT